MPSNVGSHTGSDIVCDDLGVVVRLVVSEVFSAPATSHLFHLPSNVGSHTGSDIVCDDVGVVVRLVVSEAFQHPPHLTCSICLLMLALIQALTLSVMMLVLLLGLLSVSLFSTRHISLVPFAF